MTFSGNTGWPNQPTGALWDNIAITPADSFFSPRIVVIEITDFLYDKGSGLLTLTWTSEPGRTYSVSSSTDLIDWSNELVGSLPSAGSLTSYGPFSDPAPASSPIFFRVQTD